MPRLGFYSKPTDKVYPVAMPRVSPHTVAMVLECGHAVILPKAKQGAKVFICYTCSKTKTKEEQQASMSHWIKNIPEDKKRKKDTPSNQPLTDALNAITTALGNIDRRLTDLEDTRTRPEGK